MTGDPARLTSARLVAALGLPADALAGLVREIGLEDVVTMCRQMQQGQSHGRVVVRLAGEG